MKICVIVDNDFLYKEFKKISEKYQGLYDFDFYYSKSNKSFCEKYANDKKYRPICIKEENISFLKI